MTAAFHSRPVRSSAQSLSDMSPEYYSPAIEHNSMQMSCRKALDVLNPCSHAVRREAEVRC
jgi:hypothetical protein